MLMVFKSKRKTKKRLVPITGKAVGMMPVVAECYDRDGPFLGYWHEKYGLVQGVLKDLDLPRLKVPGGGFPTGMEGGMRFMHYLVTERAKDAAPLPQLHARELILTGAKHQ